MNNNPIEPLFRTLAFKGVDEEALENFEQAFRTGYAAANDAGLPVHSYINERLNEIRDSKGLLDAWLIAICMTTFAQGIAIGRGGAIIESIDVQRAMENLCSEYPKCQVMRLQDYSRALSILIESGT